jgi:hypothetical protein
VKNTLMFTFVLLGLIDKSEWDYFESASLSGRNQTRDVHVM